MDREIPVRVKLELCHNEGECTIGTEDEATTVAISVKVEVEEIKEEEEECYELSYGSPEEEIVEGERETEEKATVVTGDDGEVRPKKKERRHECDVCGKRFQSPSALKRHKRMHSGEKPFKCEECEKAFSILDNLRRHSAIHTE